MCCPGLGGAEGRWYYEAVLLTDGLMQIGWADDRFACDPVRGQGVGDHAHSWAVDGFRQKRWCLSSTTYGERWQTGDVLGCLVDLDLNEMRFSLNGRDLGVAFRGVRVQGLFPGWHAGASMSLQRWGLAIELRHRRTASTLRELDERRALGPRDEWDL